MKKRDILIVGAGLGGLSLASLLARQGHAVRLLEKNPQTGGRARVWSEAGFTFDMGPTWYLMPEVFDDFFARCGSRREDWYALTTLDPSYRVFFGGGEVTDIVHDRARNLALFESFEAGGAARLESYLADARYKYETALRDFLYRDYTSVFQFFNWKLMTEGLRLNIFQPLDRYTARFFTDRRARQILQYHMVFLGNAPTRAPAMYSLMSHVDLNVGVFYPRGGIGAVGTAMEGLARSLGVTMCTDSAVDSILVKDGRAAGVRMKGGGTEAADLVVVNADYHHADTELLDPPHRGYSARYWSRRAVAPSMFLMYLGVTKKLPRLAHHNLYFAPDWNPHFDSITRRPSWPDAPCFYLCAASKSDPRCAPSGCESLFALVPIAPGLPDTPEIRASYGDAVMRHIETQTGETIHDSLRVKRIYTLNDFTADYNAWQGTALGLAHTLLQTAIFRPRHKSRRVRDLWFTGGYTHPGIGLPMSVISSRIVADRIAAETGAVP